MTHAPAVAELLAIGAVLISHGHCDHLDYCAIQEIGSGAKRFFVPLGVKAHLQRWGVRRNTMLLGRLRHQITRHAALFQRRQRLWEAFFRHHFKICSIRFCHD